MSDEMTKAIERARAQGKTFVLQPGARQQLTAPFRIHWIRGGPLFTLKTGGLFAEPSDSDAHEPFIVDITITVDTTVQVDHDGDECEFVAIGAAYPAPKVEKKPTAAVA